MPVTLADWNLDVKDEADIQKVLQDLPIKHVNEKSALLLHHKESYRKWFWHLKQGFSLLFYGFGSKKSMIESFTEACCQDGGVLAVNGMAHGLTVRQILHKVAKELRLPLARSNDASATLKAIQAAPPDVPLYIVIHNIEGPGLLQPGAQELFEPSSSMPFHSSDGLNGPREHTSFVGQAGHPRQRRTSDVTVLTIKKFCTAPCVSREKGLGQIAARFNWLYYDATTYEHYRREVLHLSSVLVNIRAERMMRGASTVLQTLVPNARQIFKVLAEAQLEDDEEYEGLEFSHLYRLCRERFLVGNEMALRSHLTEFSDHQMISTRRSREGADVLYIPLDADALQQILPQCDA